MYVHMCGENGCNIFTCILSMYMYIHTYVVTCVLLFIVFRTEGSRDAEHSCRCILSGLEAHVQPSQVSSNPTLHCYNYDHIWIFYACLIYSRTSL